MMLLQQIAVAVLATLATILAVLSALGIVTLGDLYGRLHAATKAGTLAAICSLLAVAVDAADSIILVRVLVVIGFLFLTSPIAAQLIGRAGYLSGAPQEEGTLMDELDGRYDRDSHALRSPDEKSEGS